MYLAIVGQGWATNERADVAVFEAANNATSDDKHKCKVFYFWTESGDDFFVPTVDQMGRVSWPLGVDQKLAYRGTVERKTFIDLAQNECAHHVTCLREVS